MNGSLNEIPITVQCSDCVQRLCVNINNVYVCTTILLLAYSERALSSVRNCFLSTEQLALPSCTETRKIDRCYPACINFVEKMLLSPSLHDTKLVDFIYLREKCA